MQNASNLMWVDMEMTGLVPDQERLVSRHTGVTVRGQALFMRDHLGRWGPAFLRRVAQADRGGVYEALAGLGLAFLQAECALLGVPAGSDKLNLIRHTETRDDRFDCGRPTDCPGGEGPAQP